MKICVCAEGPTIQSSISPVFGRCAYFLIFNGADQTPQVIENSARDGAHGAGSGAAQRIIAQDVNILICNPPGPKAMQILVDTDIQIKHTQGKTVEEALHLTSRANYKS
jgi:predicted Fe-Mo cluster-binding NifX family protein